MIAPDLLLCAIESSTDGVAILDANERYVFLNRAHTEVYGFTSPAELIGKHWSILYSEEELTKFETVIMPELRQHGWWRGEAIGRRKNDSDFHQELTLTVFSEGGLICVVRDITQRKMAELELARERAFFRLILDLNPHFIFAKDSAGRYTLANQATATAYGVSVPELLGKTDADFNPHRVQVEQFQQDDIEVLEQQREKKIPEELITTANGETHWLQTIKKPILGLDGVTKQVLGVAIDVTESKRIQLALRQSEDRLKTIIESQSDIIFEMDRFGRFTFISPACIEILGYQPREMLGNAFTVYMQPSDARTLELAYQGMVKHGYPLRSVRNEWIHKNGSVRYMSLNARIIMGEDGYVIARGSIRDITELAKLEEQLRHAQKMEAIGSLAGGVAHDFNNLLTGILGYTYLLKAQADDPTRVKELANTIEAAAESAEELTKQLLGFARKGKNQNIPVDIVAVVQKVLDLIERTIGKQIEVITDFEESHAYILGDPTQMEQVLLNLALNARDAMLGLNGGELRFRTEHIRLDGPAWETPFRLPPGEYLKISVQDTGIGIAPELQSRIFEPFFTTKELGKGTGLGLAVVYGIVKNHGGAIQVKSKQNSGTVFETLLPLFRGEHPTLEQRPPMVKGRGIILLVEDHELVRDAGAAMLRALGYTVVTAKDGEEGLAYFQKHAHEIDLAVLDMVMPNMDGPTCFRNMKKLQPNVRAILTTGYGLNNKVQELLDEGMYGFIQKPYRIDALSAVVSEALESTPPKIAVHG
jgi:two-component system cell cycle sensor histidine kinase/response regulator CckA